MRNARKGEWIRDTYEVLQVYPLQLGTMYFTRLRPKPNTDDARKVTRFILAVQAASPSPDMPLTTLLERDESLFVPAEAVFVEEETLYWVYHRLPEKWLAHRLLSSHRLPETEIAPLLQQVVRTCMQAERNGEWALIHPENLFLDDDGRVRFLYGGPSWLAFPPISPEDEGTRLGLLAYSLLTGRRMPLYTSAETVRSLLDAPDIPSVWKPFLHRMCLPSSDTPIWEEALALLEHTELAPTNPDAWKMRHAAPDQSTDTHTQTHDAIGPNNTVPPQPSFPIPWWKHRVVRLGAAALSGFILLTAIGWSATRMWMSDTASSFPISSANAKQAAIWYNQSLSAYQAKQFDRALDLGKKALAADPGRQGYYLHVAKLYQIRGDFQHGVQIMKQAVKMFPQDPAMQDGLAMQAYYAKDFMVAKAASDKAVQMNPSNPGYFYHNAKILSALGDYANAAEMMKKAIALDGSQPYYYYDLSIYQYRLGQIDPAIRSAKTAFDLDGKNPSYQAMLGILYLKKRDMVDENPSLLTEEKAAQKQKWAQESANVFDSLVKKHALNGGGFYYASVAFYYAGRLPEAVNAIQLALKADNRQALYHYQYGVVLASSGNRNEAIAQFQQATRLDENNPLYKQALDQFRK